MAVGLREIDRKASRGGNLYFSHTTVWVVVGGKGILGRHKTIGKDPGVP
jgi:hypothetical protein